MNSVAHAQHLVERLASTTPNLTQIRAIAKGVGKDQETAERLWNQGEANARLLALLIMDLKAISVHSLEHMLADIEAVAEQDQRQLCDWLIANVIMKKSALKAEAARWCSEQSLIKRRVFWSVQALTIKAAQHEHNLQLLAALEADMESAEAMAQEVMNWCAAQIGIQDQGLRARCIQLGERLALYKDYPVSKGCTSPYLPIWIETVVAKNAIEHAMPD